MEREPGIERPDASEAAEDRHDGLPRSGSLPRCPAIPYTDEEVAAAIAEADADIAAGRVIPHDLVAQWAASYASDHKPMPPEWLE